LFERRFHTDAWFAISWGALPVLAGYILQTNDVSAAVLIAAASMAFLSLVEIKASRPYKELKRRGDGAVAVDAHELTIRLELILKFISFGVILIAVSLLVWRWTG
jgi:hypothetical protein